MIILDTNVLSELMRGDSAAPSVFTWVNARPATSLYLTSITQAEILHGISMLPNGKRRNAITASAQRMFERDFEGRILPFESNAASAYADIVSSRMRGGRPISTFDAQIAAIARAHGAELATRNTKDFEGCRIRVVDPWIDGHASTS